MPRRTVKFATNDEKGFKETMMGMMITLRQRAILRGLTRSNGRVALARPAVSIMAIRPACDLRAPMHKSVISGLVGRFGYSNLSEQWNAAVRKIRERLKM